MGNFADADWTVRHRYLHPQLTKDEIEKVLESYRKMNWWP